jgi:hypothetical protein
MRSIRATWTSAIVSLAFGASLLIPPVAFGDELEDLRAYLDGRPIPLAEVSRHYCDDFSYPVIRCSRLALNTELRATSVLLLTSTEYVTVWDGASFSGAYMNVSQDYNQLITLGWNDRISSFKVRNSLTGAFTTDWYYTGTTWSFCCNTWQPLLNAYDNTFSSIRRT